MTAARLTIRGVQIRPVVVPLRRAVATKVGAFSRWPLVLVDLETEEGIVGRGYLAPYLEKVMPTSSRRSAIWSRRAGASRWPPSGSTTRPARRSG